jgi:hypothetical protein
MFCGTIRFRGNRSEEYWYSVSKGHVDMPFGVGTLRTCSPTLYRMAQKFLEAVVIHSVSSFSLRHSVCALNCRHHSINQYV